MDSAKLNDWLQVIGMFGVLAGLVFVGLELRQSHQIALAAQYQARTSDTMGLWETLLDSGFDFSSSEKPLEQLSRSEFDSRFALNNWVWISLDNHHYQHQSGFFSEEAWRGSKARILQFYSSDIGRVAFDDVRPYLRISFVELVEQLAAEANS